MNIKEFEARMLLLGFGTVELHPFPPSHVSALGKWLDLHPHRPLVLEMNYPTPTTAPTLWGRWTDCGVGEITAPPALVGPSGGVFFAMSFPAHLDTAVRVLEQLRDEKKPG